jgi:hypothetical protein
MLQQVDPGFRPQHASARATSLARPQDLLGAPPSTAITYTTTLAGDLAGPDAAARQPPLPALRAPGSIIDTRA